MIVIPAEHVRRVEHRRADERDRGDQPHQRDRDDLDRDSGLDTVDQVLARVLAVTEVARRGDGEDRHRPRDQVGAVAPEELHQLDHPRHSVLGERSGHDRLLGVDEAHVEPPGVGDVGGDITGREGRREVGDVRQPVREPDVLDEVARGRRPRHAGAVIEDVERARAWNEVHPVAADVGVGASRSVVQGERRGRLLNGPFDHVRREQDALAGRIERQPCVEQPLAEHLAADLEADLGEDALRLGDDLPEEVVVEHVDGRAHRILLSRR